MKIKKVKMYKLGEVWYTKIEVEAIYSKKLIKNLETKFVDELFYDKNNENNQFNTLLNVK